MSRRTDRRNQDGLTKRPWIATALLGLAALIAGPAAVARGGITEFDSYKVIQYTQTSQSQPTTPTGAFFAARLFSNNTTDATSVYGILGGTTPLIYTTKDNSSFLYQTTNYATPAAMDAVFTPGLSDKVTLSGGTLGTQSASFNLAQDAYSSAIPYLTGGTYSALQGMNADSAVTLNFSGFTPSSAAVNEADVFIQVVRTSDNTAVYTSAALPMNTNSITFGADYFAAGTGYTISLDYSSRVDTVGAGFGGATLVQAFDQRTFVNFTTAVPEPASLAMTALGAGLAGLGYRSRRNRS